MSKRKNKNRNNQQKQNRPAARSIQTSMQNDGSKNAGKDRKQKAESQQKSWKADASPYGKHTGKPVKRPQAEARTQGLSVNQILTTLLAMALIAIYPVFNTNGLYENLEAKYAFLTRVGTASLLAILVLYLLLDRGCVSFKTLAVEKKWLLVFGLAVIVSACMAIDPTQAWVGEDARKFNAWTILICIGIFLAVSAYVKVNELLFWVFIGGNSLLTILSIPNLYGIDTWNSFLKMTDSDQRIYLGFLGNINTNSAYASLMLGLAVILCLTVRKKRMQIASYIYVFLVFWHLFASHSDSACISIVAVIVFAWMYALSFHSRAGDIKTWMRTKKVLRMLGLHAEFLAVSVIMYLSVTFPPENSQPLLKYGKCLLLGFFVPVGILIQILLIPVLFVLIWLIGRRMTGQKGLELPAGQKKTRKIMGIVILCCILLPAAAFIILNLFLYDDAPAILQRFILSNEDGSDRMGEWRMTFSAIQKTGIKQILFGCGPNCYADMIYPYYGDQITELCDGQVLNDAHNDLLQYFSITGLFGLVSYLGFLFNLLKKGIRKIHLNPYLAGMTALIVAYLAQGIANNPSIFTTPLLFLYLGILWRGAADTGGI